MFAAKPLCVFFEKYYDNFILNFSIYIQFVLFCGNFLFSILLLRYKMLRQRYYVCSLVILLMLLLLLNFKIFQNLFQNTSQQVVLEKQKNSKIQNHGKLKNIKTKRIPGAIIIGSPKCGLYI